MRKKKNSLASRWFSTCIFTFAAFFVSLMLLPWAFIFLFSFFMYFFTELIWSMRALSVRSETSKM